MEENSIVLQRCTYLLNAYRGLVAGVGYQLKSQPIVIKIQLPKRKRRVP